MTSRALDVNPAAEIPRGADAASAGYLFHPVTDFIVAGGGSLIVAPAIIWLIRDKGAVTPKAVAAALLLSLVINFPHFAHSYQLLYTGIVRRITGSTGWKVRVRYVWAGFVVPAALGVFFVGALASGNVRALGYSANVMALTVGWHYVKQGYGVAVVLSAIRRIYYTNVEKRLLLLNGYAVWIYSWMALNEALRAETYLGITYMTLALPPLARTLAGAAAVVTTLGVVFAITRRILVRHQPVSWNGLVGYGCSLYLWVVARYTDPLFALFVPMFHSLQYLLFVWRYEINKAEVDAQSDRRARGRRPSARDLFGRFVITGLVLGWLGFIILPIVLNHMVSPDPLRWGPSLFAFIGVVWINVHHYFIDNVIWRRDNEDVRRFLFAPRLP